MKDPAFFEPSRSLTAGEVAAMTGAELTDPALASNAIVGVAGLPDGGEGMLVFLDAKSHGNDRGTFQAAALLCSPRDARLAPDGVAVLTVDNPKAAFAQVARLLFPSAARPGTLTGETGISAAAHVDASASLEDGVIVEPGAVIGPDVAIGRGTIVASHAVIGAHCRIGRDSYVGVGSSVQCAVIGDRVILGPGSRIGQDGFGYVPGARGLEKMPQLGRVVIQDDVEIGANTTVDRGALGDTIIGEGTKIDNLVQIAHNCRIGRHCVVAGNCGLSGSVVLGDRVMLGGGVGIADHVTIGDGAALAASSGLMHDIPAGQRWAGTPAKPLKVFFREQLTLSRLTGASKDMESKNG